MTYTRYILQTNKPDIIDSVAQSDRALLGKHLALLDIEVSKITEEIFDPSIPTGEHLLEEGEYFIGHGFVAIQSYLTSVRSAYGLGATEAYSEPPLCQNDLPLAKGLNTGANYWKHNQEWYEPLLNRQNKDLIQYQKDTLESLEKFTPWEDYTCSNLLAVLTKGRDFRLSALLPLIDEWSLNVSKRAHIKHNSRPE
jgi:hypothetical protein